MTLKVILRHGRKGIKATEQYFKSMMLRDKHSLGLIILPIVSGVWLAIGVGLIGSQMPNYSHLSQFMSVLGADDAPYAKWANFAVFLPAEIIIIAFLALLNSCAPHKWANRMGLPLLFAYAILLALAAFLPCDAACHNHGSDSNLQNTPVHIAHMAIAASAYPLALIGLLLVRLTSEQKTFLHYVVVPATIIGFCLFFAIILIPDAKGLFQRLLEALIYIQLILLGLSAASKVASER